MTILSSLSNITIAALLLIVLGGCATQEEKETWNSYYYGPSDMLANKGRDSIDYEHFPVDNDSTYVLPSNYWESQPNFNTATQNPNHVPRQ